MRRLTFKEKAFIFVVAPLKILWFLWLGLCMFAPFGFDQMNYEHPGVWLFWGAWAATIVGLVAQEAIEHQQFWGK